VGDRGQAFTLEAITASLLLIGGLVFALQATAVTPLSASTSSQHLENQQQAAAEGVLTTGIDDESLRRGLLYWNASARNGTGGFHNASGRGYYIDKTPPNAFGQSLNRTFTSRNIVVNVYIYYEGDGREKRQRMVYRGEPSDNAVSASTALTLYEGARLYAEDGSRATTTVTNDTFYAPNATGGGTYNTLRVEVIAWRQ
jgi:hypothetical protein